MCQEAPGITPLFREQAIQEPLIRPSIVLWNPNFPGIPSIRAWLVNLVACQIIRILLQERLKEFFRLGRAPILALQVTVFAHLVYLVNLEILLSNFNYSSLSHYGIWVVSVMFSTPHLYIPDQVTLIFKLQILMGYMRGMRNLHINFLRGLLN